MTLKIEDLQVEKIFQTPHLLSNMNYCKSDDIFPVFPRPVLHRPILPPSLPKARPPDCNRPWYRVQVKIFPSLVSLFFHKVEYKGVVWAVSSLSKPWSYRKCTGPYPQVANPVGLGDSGSESSVGQQSIFPHRQCLQLSECSHKVSWVQPLAKDSTWQGRRLSWP